jgi:hypothetical protein
MCMVQFGIGRVNDVEKAQRRFYMSDIYRKGAHSSASESTDPHHWQARGRTVILFMDRRVRGLIWFLLLWPHCVEGLPKVGWGQASRRVKGTLGEDKTRKVGG